MEMARIGLNVENRKAFADGVRDGVPIGLGYLAVSFSLGIAARNAGLDWFQSLLTSLLCNASAGEYAGFTVMAANAAYFEMVLMTLVANARYLLMSCSMSQRMRPGEKLIHRLIIGFDITDELFAISIARPGYLNPFYTYGAMVPTIPLWAGGTALGNIAGALLPQRLVSAFSVALYGMFLAVIIPPAKKDRVVGVLVAVCFAASFAATYLPVVSEISAGTRTIVLTVVISAVAALLFPRAEAPSEEGEKVCGRGDER